MVALLVALSGAAHASPTAAAADGSRGELDLPLLLDLPGKFTALRYTPGALDRAVHFQRRLELLAESFADLGRARPLAAWVLSREEWERVGFARPYGLPEMSGDFGIAAPAWGDDGTVALWRRLLAGQVPSGSAVPLRGTAEEAASLGLADLLAQVEVCRRFVSGSPLEGDAPWVAGVMTHLVALLAFERFEGARVPEIVVIFDSLAAASRTPPPPGPMDDPAAPPSHPAFALEAQYLHGAEAILAEAGPRGARKLLRKQIKAGKPFESGILLGKYPALASWLTTFSTAGQ